MARESVRRDPAETRTPAKSGGTPLPGHAGGAERDIPRSDGGRVLRIMALIAVATGVTAVTAAACALSYRSIHILAVQAGVSEPLARIYPFVFDVMLALAGCSVLALRGAGLPSRVYGWLSFLVLLAALAAGAALRAAYVAVPRHLASVIAAVVPFILVLVAFGLLLALVRHARLRRTRQRSVGYRAGTAVFSSAAAFPGTAVGPGSDVAGGDAEAVVDTGYQGLTKTAEPPTLQRLRSSPTPPED